MDTTDYDGYYQLRDTREDDEVLKVFDETVMRLTELRSDLREVLRGVSAEFYEETTRTVAVKRAQADPNWYSKALRVRQKKAALKWLETHRLELGRLLPLAPRWPPVV